MIKSMTGFAAVSHEDEWVALTVTLRSVNHRYLDVQIHLPQVLVGLDYELRSLIRKYIARGHVQLDVTIRLKTMPDVGIDLNESLIEELAKVSQLAKKHGWTERGISVGDLLRFPQAMTVSEQPMQDDTWNSISLSLKSTTSRAINELDKMRLREGEFILGDLEERITELRRLVDQIVSESAAGSNSLSERLLEKLDELGVHDHIEQLSVSREVVRLVARSDIHEEISRVKGHLDHMASLAAETEPCGRKLDFLVQEMNREVNTIGSKAEGQKTSNLIVASKAELEKLREQIQNVE